MVEIKKQVAKPSSKNLFKTYRRNQPPNPQPPNTISNAETDDEDEEEKQHFLLMNPKINK